MALKESFILDRCPVSLETIIFVSLRRYLFMGQGKPYLIRFHGGGNIFKLGPWLHAVSPAFYSSQTVIQRLLMLCWHQSSMTTDAVQIWISLFRKSLNVVMDLPGFISTSLTAPTTKEVWLYFIFFQLIWVGVYFTKFCARNSDLLHAPMNLLVSSGS